MLYAPNFRELILGQTRWTVREVDTSRVPGARGAHCLLFENDTVIRRVWVYPANWADLPDDAVWHLAEEQPDPSAPVYDVERVVPVVKEEPVTPPGATAITETTRSLMHDVGELRERRALPRTQRRELQDRCHRRRREMREAVVAFAVTLRQQGVPAERALVLLKAAMQDGIAGACRDEPVAEEVIRDGVDWWMAEYFVG